jgi:hypothetical protein
MKATRTQLIISEDLSYKCKLLSKILRMWLVVVDFQKYAFYIDIHQNLRATIDPILIRAYVYAYSQVAFKHPIQYGFYWSVGHPIIRSQNSIKRTDVCRDDYFFRWTEALKPKVLLRSSDIISDRGWLYERIWIFFLNEASSIDAYRLILLKD